MTQKTRDKNLAKRLQEKVPNLAYAAALSAVRQGQADRLDVAAALAALLAEQKAHAALWSKP